MDSKGAHRLKNQRKNVICQIINGAGHQLIFDNPEGVVAKILR
jgi:pimeloyl-ACP methyl ester carboxylesterase